MSLPSITHLQFLVLGALMDGDSSGRRIRERLAEHRVHKTGPAFYQMMARLEDSGFVQGWYNQKIVEGQIIKERHYKITSLGIEAWESVRDFYIARIGINFRGA
jgi:DNA-binding PadR family transcriptional regulator